MYQLKIIFYGLFCQNIAYFVTAEGECAQQSTPKPQSVTLKDDLLFCGYDKAVSQKHQNDKVTYVNITMMIKSISVDDQFNTIYVHTWNILEWIDERLSWKISEYGGVNVLHLDNEEIWIPPVNLFVPHSFWGLGDSHPTGRCNVLPNGKVVCVTSNSYTHHCAPDFAYWPQDTINCRIFIFSSGQDVVFHLKEGKINTIHYNENNEWGLLSAMIYINGATEFNYTYQWITIDLSLQRQNNMHLVSMTFPALVLSFLVLVTFWLDANEEYRIKLLCVAIVCNCLQLFSIEDQVGNTGDTLPLLVKFYRDSFIMSGMSLLITVAIQILLKLQYAPNWLPVTRLFIMKYQIAHILLITEEATKEENGREEDGLLKSPPIDASLEWNVFVKLLDRAFFLLFLFIYLFTILKFLLVDVTNPTFEHELIYYKVILADNCEVKPIAKTASLRLKENILECGYDKTVRPVVYHGNQTAVTISMKLRKLTHDPYIRSMIIHCWMIWEWKDEHLHWNPSDYEGVDTLTIDSVEIWVPEIAQLSSSSYWEVERRIPYGTCQVGSTGIVRCTSDTVYYSICTAELTYWPYDSMNCSLLLGAWMQEGEEITIQITDNNVDLHEYEADHHWILDSATVTRHLEKYEVNTTIPWIQYSFFIRRHASLYEATVVLPGILFGILVLITFWILPEGSNRINLCCVAVICHYLQLQYVGWTLGGEGEKCPLVVLFYRDSLVLNCLAIFFAIVSRTLVSTTVAVPAWVSKYTGWILSCRFGQILLLTEISPEIAATANEDGKEEGTGLVAATKTEPASTWKIFVKLIDRISFVFCLLIYIFMVIRCFV